MDNLRGCRVMHTLRLQSMGHLVRVVVNQHLVTVQCNKHFARAWVKSEILQKRKDNEAQCIAPSLSKH